MMRARSDCTHERHRKVWEPAHCLTGGEHRYDMWLLECRGELDLPAESCRREIVGELRRQHLDDDIPAEGFVASDEHAGHPTGAQLPLHRVVAAERFLELIEEIVQGFLGAGSLMYGWGGGFACFLKLQLTTAGRGTTN